MMEPSYTKKLNHGSTHLLDLWPHSIHRHHHSNYVSLHLQNLRQDEVCSTYFYFIQLFHMRLVRLIYILNHSLI